MHWHLFTIFSKFWPKIIQIPFSADGSLLAKQHKYTSNEIDYTENGLHGE